MPQVWQLPSRTRRQLLHVQPTCLAEAPHVHCHGLVRHVETAALLEVSVDDDIRDAAAVGVTLTYPQHIQSLRFVAIFPVRPALVLVVTSHWNGPTFQQEVTMYLFLSI